MTVGIFFWYILPLGIAAASFGWIVYDRGRSRKNGTPLWDTHGTPPLKPLIP